MRRVFLARRVCYVCVSWKAIVFELLGHFVCGTSFSCARWVRDSCVRLCSGWFGDLLLGVRIVPVVICHLRVVSFVAYLPFECELLVCPTLFVICPSPLCDPAAR